MPRNDSPKHANTNGSAKSARWKKASCTFDGDGKKERDSAKQSRTKIGAEAGRNGS